MDLGDFETALAIYECGNWAEASYKTYQSTSSVSKHVRKLEEELGVKIFNRGAAENELLTPAGSVALPIIKEMSSVYSHLLASAEQLRFHDAHSLRVGYLPIIGDIGVADILSELRADYPDIRIDHVLRCQNELVHLLTEGKLDAAFIYFVNSVQDPMSKLKGLISGNIATVRIMTNEGLYIGMSSKHPLARRESVDIHELEGEAFVLNRVSYHLDGLKGFAQNVFCLSDNEELPCQTRIMDYLQKDAIVDYVRDGNGVLPVACNLPSFIPEGISFVRATGTNVTSTAFLVYTESSPNNSLRALVEYARTYASEGGVS